MKISSEEWAEISYELEQHHAVFYKIWQMGKPIFDEKVETACVSFDKEGNFINFYFNPDFWNKIDFNYKKFVICHEALHIILNHGSRSKNAQMNAQSANMAMDVVVNHSLVNNFGFNREELENWQDLCWVDTVFKEHPPEDDQSFEYYYNMFEKYAFSVSCQTLVDEHSDLGNQEWDAIQKELNSHLTEEEKESLKQTIQNHYQTDEVEKKAGKGTGQWSFVTAPKIKRKQKWETIIKKWTRKSLLKTEVGIEQWIRMNRRLAMLPRTMFLPSEMEVEGYFQNKSKIDVWFYLDTSGSCWYLKDRFFAAASSLPPEKFNVRLFCFDTDVKETTLESKKVYGGGGTSFDILEKNIQKELRNGELKKYPDTIWVITDGYGNAFKPAHPSRWHWFLTEGGTKSYIPPDSICHDLKDFE